MKTSPKNITITLPLSYAMVAYLVLSSQKNNFSFEDPADEIAINTLETELQLALKEQAEDEYLAMRNTGSIINEADRAEIRETVGKRVY